MKICNTCKKEKSLEEFYKDKFGAQGRGVKCKECCSLYYKQNKDRYDIYYQENKDNIKRNFKNWLDKNPTYYKDFHESQKDGYTYVYLLPEYNYVGVTCNLKNRMKRHKLDGRINNNYVILDKFTDRDIALSLEKEYHDKGYSGRENNMARYK